MWQICRRFLSAQNEGYQNVSNVKWKLQQLSETGHLRRSSVRESKSRHDRSKINSKNSFATGGISPQKALILLKSKYDGAILPDGKGSAINLHALSPNNLRINDPKSLQIFKGLMQAKKVQRRPIDDRIIMTLTGVTRDSLRDSYFVARDVAYLLERDNDIDRAMEICRLARKEGSVGLNAILGWCLKRSKNELANKVLVSRGRWGIPLSSATYVTYFSGLSDNHEWGKVSDQLARDVIRRFKEEKVTQNVETFNAALKLLMKNFENDQALAWSFFEILQTLNVSPNAQTFTIFLQGLKTHYKSKVESIQKTSSMSQNERISKLFMQQAILVQQANMIWDKVMVFATPPKPPSESEINESPQRLFEYRKKITIPALDIDRHLAVAFLSCYTDSSAGTSWANNGGSHYWYLQQALRHLQAWIPELNDMIKLVTSSKTCETKAKEESSRYEQINSVTVNLEIVRKTERRMTAVGIPIEASPKHVVGSKSMDKLNPWVSFPASPFSHRRDKRRITGVDRQLIDFARVKYSELYKEFTDYRKRKTRSYNVPLRTKSSFKRQKHGVNKFLMRIFLDTILRLGLYEEFYKAMWLSISLWADIKLDKKKLREANPVQSRALSVDNYPVIESLSNLKSDMRFCDSDADLNVIDIGLVEDFIHKIEEHMPRHFNPTALALEVVAAFSNRNLNVEKELRPRPSTFSAIFSMLNRDLYRYGDRNVTLMVNVDKEMDTKVKPVKNTITYAQLEEFLESLDVLVRCIFSRFGGTSMDNSFLQSYNNLLQRVYASDWNIETGGEASHIRIHKKIIRSGILMYKPDHLVDEPREIRFSKAITRSMSFVHGHLRSRADLSGEEVDLMMCLRNLFNMERNKVGTKSEYEALQMKIYTLTGYEEVKL